MEQIKFSIHNARYGFSLDLSHRITVLHGNSGRGKTVMYQMIRNYVERGSKSALRVSCPLTVDVMSHHFKWQDANFGTGNLIFAADSDNLFHNEEFIKTALASECYFVFISRAAIWRKLKGDIQEVEF